jgi:nitrite reductase/ring-hydroxylating ferredoxin subunit
VSPLPPEALEAVGRVYVEVYTALWDEDEEMMRERAGRLREQSDPPPDTSVDLGTESELRARLPVDVVFEGRRFRVDEHAGRFVAYATVCPHMLGPLFRADAVGADAEELVLECPWHGYRYDLAEGRSCDGQGLRLPAAPAVSLDAVPGRCTLVRAGR